MQIKRGFLIKIAYVYNVIDVYIALWMTCCRKDKIVVVIVIVMIEIQLNVLLLKVQNLMRLFILGIHLRSIQLILAVFIPLVYNTQIGSVLVRMILLVDAYPI